MRREVNRAAVLVALAAWCGCAVASRGQSTQPAATTASAASGHTISGALVNSKTGLPIADADVYLSNAKENKRVADTKTDTEGNFSFPDLRDGKYGLLRRCIFSGASRILDRHCDWRRIGVHWP
jgi:hypothetical protein